MYLAAPLFSVAERAFNERLAANLERLGPVYLPQRDGALVPDLIASGLSRTEAKRAVFQRDIGSIQECEVLVAVLDGRTIDEGVAVELGYAYAIGKPCIGYKTDFRQLSEFGDNPMIEGTLLHSTTDLADLLRTVGAARERLVPRADCL